MHNELGRQDARGQFIPPELLLVDDVMPYSADGEVQRRGFPDNPSAVVAFMDVMTAALGALMIQHELRRLQAGLAGGLSRQVV